MSGLKHSTRTLDWRVPTHDPQAHHSCRQQFQSWTWTVWRDSTWSLDDCSQSLRVRRSQADCLHYLSFACLHLAAYLCACLWFFLWFVSSQGFNLWVQLHLDLVFSESPTGTRPFGSCFANLDEVLFGHVHIGEPWSSTRTSRGGTHLLLLEWKSDTWWYSILRWWGWRLLKYSLVKDDKLKCSSDEDSHSELTEQVQGFIQPCSHPSESSMPMRSEPF